MILLLFLSLLSFVSARWEEVTNLCYEDNYLYACVTEDSYTLMIGNSINEAVPNPTSTPQIIINDNVVDNFIELRHNGKHSSRCTDAIIDYVGTSQCCTNETDYTSQSYTAGSTCIDLDQNVYFVNKEFDGPKSAPLFCGDCGGDQRWWRSSFAHPNIPFTRWETKYVGTFNYGYVGVPDNICVDHYNTVTNDNFYSVQDDTNKPWNSVTKVCAYERHVYACAHGPTLSGGRGGVNRLPSDISAHQYNFPVLTIDSVETRHWITIDGNAKRSSCGDLTSILYVYGLCSPNPNTTTPEVVPASEFSILDAAALKTDLESSCGVCDYTWWRTVNETQFTADSVWRITGTDYPVSGFDIKLQDKDYSKIPNTFQYRDVAFNCSDLPESHVCNDDCGYNLVLPVCDGTNTDKNCQCGNCACAAGRDCNSGICLPSRDLKIKHTEQCACISTQKMDNGICVNCPVGKLSTPFIDCGCDIEIGSEISFSKGDYFDETSWEIRQCNNDLILEGNYSSVNDCLHLPDNYIVVLKDSYGDGWNKYWVTGKDNVLTISNTPYTFSAGRRAYFEIGSCCVAENSHISTTTGECECNNNYRDVYSDASECQICPSNTELINNVCVACHSSMESESGGQCTCMSGLTELSVHSGQNPEKIAWEIKDSGGNIINSGNSYDDSCKNDICDVQCVDLNNAKTMNLINLINDLRWEYHSNRKFIEYYVLLNGIKYFHIQHARSTLHNIMCTSSDCATCDSGLTQVMVYSGGNPSKMVWEFRQNDDTVINSENYLYKSFDHCQYGICEYLCLDLPDSYKLTLKNSIGVSNWGFSYYKIVINDNTSEPREYTHTVSDIPITYYINDEHCTDVVIKNEHEPLKWDYTEARVEIRSCSGNAIYNVFPKSGIDYVEVCLPPKYNIVLLDTYGDGWDNWNITINNNYFKLVSGSVSIQEHDNRC